MEMDELSESVALLERAIDDFPYGARTSDDSKPIEAKILDLRQQLKAINARRLTLDAIIDSARSDEASEDDDMNPNLNRCFDRLNESTTNYLTNTKCIQLCYHSKGIQDILYKNKGTPEIREKVKLCLDKLFDLNDKLSAKNERRRELMQKQYQLKLECHHITYEHQDYLKEKEDKRNQKLQENNPDIVDNKDRINRSLNKIYNIKKLITNLIASMCHEINDNDILVEMLAKHKEVVNLETIVEMAQNQSSS